MAARVRACRVGWVGETEFKNIPPSNPVGSRENVQFPWQPVKFPRCESPPPLLTNLAGSPGFPSWPAVLCAGPEAEHEYG